MAPSNFYPDLAKMKLLYVTLITMLVSPVCATQSFSQAVSVINAVQGTPVIDGKIDDQWSSTQIVATNKIVESESETSADDVSVGYFRCLWDASHIYVLAEIHDSKISLKSRNPWEQDSIEIFLDENKERTKGFQPDDSQYRISANGKVTVGGFGSAKKVRVATSRSEKGFIIEVGIAVKSKPISAGRELGIEFQVNNDDGSGKRVSLAKWNLAKNDAWHSTENYGTLKLVQKLAPGIPTKRTQLPSAKRNQVDDEGPGQSAQNDPDKTKTGRVPDWAADAVFYQIFPERFRNGDKTNDPTVESLEFPDIIPANWRVTSWTKQWYSRDEWEKELGDNFYDDGVFHRRYGGDLQGVIDKLDYLAELGINTIYFNPVFYARSLHKYDGNSFHHVDPHFGPDPKGDFEIMETETADPATWKWTAADKLFLKLLERAHDKKIRVIIDGVFNHTGRDFFAFQDIVKKQEKSDYIHWYMIESFDDPKTKQNEFKYKGWWGVDTLPEFANNKQGDDLHPDPKSYVMTATRRWMDPNNDGNPEDGIDGWRLDVANEVPNKFWRDWNKMVRQINPEAYTVAEIWKKAGEYLEDCGFSATMNYHGFAFPVKGFLIDGKLEASRFARMLEERMNEHDQRVQYALQNLIDSHDTDRVASMIVNARRDLDYVNGDRFDYDVGERVSARWDAAYDVRPPNQQDKQVLRLVAMFQMTFVGAPMVYYGTEAGMDGGDDPDDRMPMIWGDLNYEPRNAGPKGKLERSFEVRFDRELFDYYRSIISIRQASDALRRGKFDVVHTDDAKKVMAFIRHTKNERVLVVINRGLNDCQLTAKELKLQDNEQLTHLGSTRQGGSVAKFSQQINIPGISGGIWKIERK